MKLTVHIDRLIVDGAELSHRERRELLETVQAELRDLLLGHSADARPRVANEGPSDLPPGATRVAELGRDVAEGVHRAMTPLPMRGDARVASARRGSVPS
jgi:hypothetical protein